MGGRKKKVRKAKGANVRWGGGSQVDPVRSELGCADFTPGMSENFIPERWQGSVTPNLKKKKPCSMFLPWGWKNDNISGEVREAQLFFFFFLSWRDENGGGTCKSNRVNEEVSERTYSQNNLICRSFHLKSFRYTSPSDICVHASLAARCFTCWMELP